ncbi:MAG: SDR family NAD(P)-dependent oxidoreductase [Actinobacteria bacterium]|nr:SDR family NAD(P)-dependent oxidoreductase [Actinomycetota bacterium]
MRTHGCPGEAPFCRLAGRVSPPIATNRAHITATPEQVFAVLADADRYPDWVVGASHTVDSDAEFPAPGARFRHRVGIRPLALTDYTEVVALDPPRRIELKAKARPLGTADITITLREVAEGTEVKMVEGPGDLLTSLVASNPVADAVLRIRNAEALARFKRLVEERPTGLPQRRRRGLAGQRVLITGGSSGIGLAVAERLTAEGARVVLLARDEEGLATARERAGAVDTVTADVRDHEAVEAATARAVALLGGLDVLVTAAVGSAWGPFVDTYPQDFDATVATVLSGTANAVRAALPHLECSRGAVVAIGSTAAHLPLPSMSAYSAAKHGLVGLIDSLRIELREAGSPTTISLVNPGPVDTPLWDHLESQNGLLPPVPPDRYSPEGIAAAVVSVIRRPREEVTVGASAALQVHAWHLLRGTTSLGLTALARLAQAAEDKEAGAGALHTGRGTGATDGGHGGRTGLLIRGIGARDALERALRR